MKARVILLVPGQAASNPIESGPFLSGGRLVDTPSVRRMVLEALQGFPAVKGITAVLLDPSCIGEDGKVEGLESVDSIIPLPESGVWTRASLLEAVCSQTSGEEELLWWAWADCPLLDPDLAERMYQRHVRWHAEYTNADGWPAGFAAELVNRATLAALAWIAREDQSPVDRDLLFQVVQKDINSFDIETEISSIDLRSRRLSFYADSRRNWLLIERFLAHGYRKVEDTALFVKDHPEDLRTLPAYWSIQTGASCVQDCPLCPWPQASKKESGLLPSQRSEQLSLENFKLILDKAVRFSGDAVIDISLWGESSLNPAIVDMARAVLDRPELSLIIETSGLGWREGDIEAIVDAAKKAPRRSGFPSSSRPGPLSWIVSLDALGQERYCSLRGKGQDEALKTAKKLLELCPQELWVQALRLNDGEEDLEAFWKTWKDAGANVIIQKYNYFSGYLGQRRAADLSPLKRQACWHLMRDIAVLVDGTVPLCKDDLGRRGDLGNILASDMEEIWKRSDDLWRSHAMGIYPGTCADCDEYYTWNY